MKKKMFFILALCFFLIPITTKAEIVEVGDSVTVTGEHDSSKFIFGNDVKVDAEIDGIVEIFGNTVNTNGKVSYALYFGNQLNIGDEVLKDAFIFGNNVKINSDATLSRDVNIFASTLVLETDVERNMVVYANKVEISDVTINGDLTIFASEIVLNKSANIVGTLTYYEDTIIDGIEEANIGNVVTYEKPANEYDIKYIVLTWLKNLAMNIISLLVILLLFPKIKKGLDEIPFEGSKIILNGALGFVALILIPFISLIAIICEYTIPLAFILLALYFIAMYIGWLYVSYMIGKKVWSLSKKKENIFVEGIIGLIITELVVLIPKLGGFIGFILFIIGIGLFLTQFKKISFIEKN